MEHNRIEEIFFEKVSFKMGEIVARFCVSIVSVQHGQRYWHHLQF